MWAVGPRWSDRVEAGHDHLGQPGETGVADLAGGAAPWANVLNESFRSWEVLNDSFKTFGSGCGGRSGRCRGGGDTEPGEAGFGAANESLGASGVAHESFATSGPRTSGLGSGARQRRKPGG